MRRFLQLCILVAVLGACAGGPKVVDDVDPFYTPREDFKRSTRILALAEVHLPDGTPEPQGIREQFSTLIEQKLRKAGYTVVHPQRYATVWNQVETEVGGFADSLTGEPRSDALAMAMAETMQRLNADFEVDAVVIPAVTVVEAAFGGGRAVWDGIAQSVKTGSPVKNFFAGSPDGTLGALSLRVRIVTTTGDPLYEKLGGIQVLSLLEGKDFVLVPRDELLTDPERIENAVNIALDPLVD
jgi:hypothetical protein